MFTGIDGCKAGWLAASIIINNNNNNNNNKIHISIYNNIDELWQSFKKAYLIFIDIPIGLIDCYLKEKERSCDIYARKLLSPKRGSSVFATPSREAVYSLNYKDACKINKQITGRKISIQAFFLMVSCINCNTFAFFNFNLNKTCNRNSCLHKNNYCYIFCIIFGW